MQKVALIFARNGVMTPVVSAAFAEYQAKGHITRIINAAYTDNFKSKCSVVVADEDYPHARAYAEELSVEFVLLGETATKKVSDPVVESEPEPVDEVTTSVDDLISEIEGEAPIVHEVPEKIEVGLYKNKVTGEEFEKKQGPFVVKAFKESILEHGWDKFEKVD